MNFNLNKYIWVTQVNYRRKKIDMGKPKIQKLNAENK